MAVSGAGGPNRVTQLWNKTIGNRFPSLRIAPSLGRNNPSLPSSTAFAGSGPTTMGKTVGVPRPGVVSVNLTATPAQATVAEPLVFTDLYPNLCDIYSDKSNPLSGLAEKVVNFIETHGYRQVVPELRLGAVRGPIAIIRNHWRFLSIAAFVPQAIGTIADSIATFTVSNYAVNIPLIIIQNFLFMTMPIVLIGLARLAWHARKAPYTYQRNGEDLQKYLGSRAFKKLGLELGLTTLKAMLAEIRVADEKSNAGGQGVRAAIEPYVKAALLKLEQTLQKERQKAKAAGTTVPGSRATGFTHTVIAPAAADAAADPAATTVSLAAEPKYAHPFVTPGIAEIKTNVERVCFVFAEPMEIKIGETTCLVSDSGEKGVTLKNKDGKEYKIGLHELMSRPLIQEAITPGNDNYDPQVARALSELYYANQFAIDEYVASQHETLRAMSANEAKATTPAEKAASASAFHAHQRLIDASSLSALYLMVANNALQAQLYGDQPKLVFGRKDVAALEEYFIAEPDQRVKPRPEVMGRLLYASELEGTEGQTFSARVRYYIWLAQGYTDLLEEALGSSLSEQRITPVVLAHAANGQTGQENRPAPQVPAPAAPTPEEQLAAETSDYIGFIYQELKKARMDWNTDSVEEYLQALSDNIDLPLYAAAGYFHSISSVLEAISADRWQPLLGKLGLTAKVAEVKAKLAPFITRENEAIARNAILADEILRPQPAPQPAPAAVSFELSAADEEVATRYGSADWRPNWTQLPGRLEDTRKPYFHQSKSLVLRGLGIAIQRLGSANSALTSALGRLDKSESIARNLATIAGHFVGLHTSMWNIQHALAATAVSDENTPRRMQLELAIKNLREEINRIVRDNEYGLDIALGLFLNDCRAYLESLRQSNLEQYNALVGDLTAGAMSHLEPEDLLAGISLDEMIRTAARVVGQISLPKSSITPVVTTERQRFYVFVIKLLTDAPVQTGVDRLGVTLPLATAEAMHVASEHRAVQESTQALPLRNELEKLYNHVTAAFYHYSDPSYSLQHPFIYDQDESLLKLDAPLTADLTALRTSNLHQLMNRGALAQRRRVELGRILSSFKQFREPGNVRLQWGAQDERLTKAIENLEAELQAFYATSAPQSRRFEADLSAVLRRINDYFFPRDTFGDLPAEVITRREMADQDVQAIFPSRFDSLSALFSRGNIIDIFEFFSRAAQWGSALSGVYAHVIRDLHTPSIFETLTANGIIEPSITAIVEQVIGANTVGKLLAGVIDERWLALAPNAEGTTIPIPLPQWLRVPADGFNDGQVSAIVEQLGLALEAEDSDVYAQIAEGFLAVLQARVPEQHGLIATLSTILEPPADIDPTTELRTSTGSQLAVGAAPEPADPAQTPAPALPTLEEKLTESDRQALAIHQARQLPDAESGELVVFSSSPDALPASIATNLRATIKEHISSSFNHLHAVAERKERFEVKRDRLVEFRASAEIVRTEEENERLDRAIANLNADIAAIANGWKLDLNLYALLKALVKEVIAGSAKSDFLALIGELGVPREIDLERFEHTLFYNFSLSSLVEKAVAAVLAFPSINPAIWPRQAFYRILLSSLAEEEFALKPVEHNLTLKDLAQYDRALRKLGLIHDEPAAAPEVVIRTPVAVRPEAPAARPAPAPAVPASAPAPAPAPVAREVRPTTQRAFLSGTPVEMMGDIDQILDGDTVPTKENYAKLRSQLGKIGDDYPQLSESVDDALDTIRKYYKKHLEGK